MEMALLEEAYLTILVLMMRHVLLHQMALEEKVILLEDGKKKILEII